MSFKILIYIKLCTLSCVTKQNLNRTLRLAIRVCGSGLYRPDYTFGFNTNPTRLIIGSKLVTRTRPNCEPGYTTRTRAHPTTSVPKSQSALQSQEKRTKVTKQHNPPMVSKPRSHEKPCSQPTSAKSRDPKFSKPRSHD
jgi:hypothetical protein